MKKSILSESLQIGKTTVYVQNLEVMERFYKELLGLHILEKTAESTTLGFDTKEILMLVSAEKLPPQKSQDAGLYHNAIVFSSRGELARTVQRIIKNSPQSYAGTADHLVSEAFYFTDPEGNGLELYYDKDASTWQWKNGQIQMASIYIDPLSYISEYHDVHDSQEKHMGHVHLKVGNIEKAKQFYVDILGFDITAELPGALFVSVGGYHHHLGMNIWGSEDAPVREKTLGLKNFELILPNTDDLELLKKRLITNNVTKTEESDFIEIADPWDNKIHIQVS